MRRQTPKSIVVHCSATHPNQNVTAADIRVWHKRQGWADIGYHLVIQRDNTVRTGRPLDRQGAGVKGHNKDVIHICLVGGVDANGKPEFNYTETQMALLKMQLATLCVKFDIPYSEIYGHNDFTDKKACPCFNVKKWVKENL